MKFLDGVVPESEAEVHGVVVAGVHGLGHHLLGVVGVSKDLQDLQRSDVQAIVSLCEVAT